MKRCPQCDTTKSLDLFGTRLGGTKPASWCKECVRQKNRRSYRTRHPNATTTRELRRKKIDAVYDYSFARDILGFTQGRAMEWIASGYRVDPRTVEVWDVSTGTSWQPDPA